MRRFSQRRGDREDRNAGCRSVGCIDDRSGASGTWEAHCRYAAAVRRARAVTACTRRSDVAPGAREGGHSAARGSCQCNRTGPWISAARLRSAWSTCRRYRVPRHGQARVARSGRPERGAGLVGLKMYYALAASQLEALRYHVELILFAGGYAGLQLVESDRAVLCALLPAARLRAAGGQWSGLLDALTDECPHLRERLAGARGLLDRPLTIAGLPYGYVHAPVRRDPPGLFRLGDQAAVIASLTGDGVALALGSGSLAARTWIAGRAQRGLPPTPGRRPLTADAPCIRYPSSVPCAETAALGCRRVPAVARRDASRSRRDTPDVRRMTATQTSMGHEAVLWAVGGLVGSEYCHSPSSGYENTSRSWRSGRRTAGSSASRTGNSTCR